MTCTFFGHSGAPCDIELALKSALVNLIENHGAKKFYVGTHGNFDTMSFNILEELSAQYSIEFFKVLSRVPTKNADYDKTDYSRAVVPAGIENTPPRFRINYRNRWMIEQSQFVITYITNRFGTGAAEYARLAEKAGKIVIKLGDV